MKGVYTKKVEGGKLLRVKVEHGYILENVQITGDFFAHPEDSVEQIENALLDCHARDGIDASVNGSDFGNDDYVTCCRRSFIARLCGRFSLCCAIDLDRHLRRR